MLENEDQDQDSLSCIYKDLDSEDKKMFSGVVLQDSFQQHAVNTTHTHYINLFFYIYNYEKTPVWNCWDESELSVNTKHLHTVTSTEKGGL